MIAEAYIENSQMRVINFPKEFLESKHWKINIEPIEKIKDNVDEQKLVYTTKDPMKHLTKLNYEYDEDLCEGVKPYSHINDSAKYIHDLRRKRR